jgi:curved DNA-binding protein CbpA
MVTVDVKRDYYADLGLTPEADDKALKKQYKKLGT